MANAIGMNDVLCGRGGATNNHPGNKRFRNIVAEHMAEYLRARKKEKAVIARRVVGLIKQDGGRFLKRSPHDDVWVEVTEKKAVEKTSQALREGLDVRHGRYRPEKMTRPDSDSSFENPRKRTRKVEGKVAESPIIVSRDAKELQSAAVPELRNEGTSQSHVESLMVFFEPPRITKADCEDVAAV